MTHHSNPPMYFYDSNRTVKIGCCSLELSRIRMRAAIAAAARAVVYSGQL